MTTFTRGKRENVGLWINLIGGTGSGKTYTAMRLAAGIAGDKPFAVIDTENRRALHYGDSFVFDHAEIKAPFTPATYADAVVAADAAGYPVIVIDSGSHVWAGDGGVLDMQEEELERMAGSDFNKRKACLMASWIKPKREHKKMVSKLLQLKAHLILCLRSEPKIEMVKEKDGRGNMQTVVRPKQSLTGLDGWLPVCDKNLPFEATCSFLLTADRPGLPHPIKLQEQHRALFPPDVPISEESGQRLAQWASGATKAAAPNGDDIAKSVNPSLSNSPSDAAAPTITPDEALTLEARCTDNNIPTARVKKYFKIERLSQLTSEQLVEAHTMIDKTLAERAAK